MKPIAPTPRRSFLKQLGTAAFAAPFVTRGLLAALRDVMGSTTPIVVFVQDVKQEKIVSEFNKELQAKGKPGILTAKTVKEAVKKAV